MSKKMNPKVPKSGGRVYVNFMVALKVGARFNSEENPFWHANE